MFWLFWKHHVGCTGNQLLTGVTVIYSLLAPNYGFYARKGEITFVKSNYNKVQQSLLRKKFKCEG